LLNSRYTRCHEGSGRGKGFVKTFSTKGLRKEEKRGFAFSTDAVIATVLVGAALALLAVQPSINTSVSGLSLKQASDDVFLSMQRSGFMLLTIDSNAPSEAVAQIRLKALGLLPENTELFVELKQFDLNIEECRANKTFNACFESVASVNSGPAIPSGKEVVGGTTYFFKKQGSSDCNLSYLELKEFEGMHEDYGSELFFSEQKPLELFFQEEGGGEDLNINFDVNVSPSESISCDENVTVTLSVSVPENVRTPIDVVLVLDRSGSMSWNGYVSTSSANSVWGNDGNYVFVGDGSAGVRAIDVSNPRLPVIVDTIDPGSVNDVYGEGNYLYATETASDDELIAYDVSNPSDLQQLDRLIFSSVYGVFALNDFVFVAGDRSGGGNNRGLYIVDASNKSDLTNRGRANQNYARSSFVVGNTAFLAIGSNGFATVDVTNKDAPVVLDTYDTSGYGWSTLIEGNYGFGADGEAGLQVFDISNLNNIQLADNFDTPDYSYSVFVLGNKAYVADYSSLQILDVSDPNNVVFEKSFSSPYEYQDLFVKDNFAFLAAGSIGFITLDLINGPRIDNAKQAASEFVDFNGWSLPPDQIGVVSFNTSATLNQQLTTNKTDLNSAIYSLVASGGTNIEEGIRSATTELTSVRANPNALHFQVVLSDGQSNSGNSLLAAQDAADEEIVIYTVGFGADASEAELTAIAEATGGSYYFAEDDNALSEIFNLIAEQIEELANDSNVNVPIGGGALVSNPGSGSIVDGNLLFNSGSITPDTPWSASYILNFPCSNAFNCSIDALSFPGEGSYFEYVDVNGITRRVDFNVSTTLDFLNRDLTVDIYGAELVGESSAEIDVNVANVGDLNSGETLLNFYLDDINGTLLDSKNVPELCGLNDSVCTSTRFTVFSPVSISQEGVIYAVVNDNNSVSECPNNNFDAVNCFGGPATEYYALEYRVWRE